MTDGTVINYETAPKHFNPGLKIGWAKHHLRRMDKVLRRFLESEPRPYSITQRDDAEAGLFVVAFDLQAPPIELALMAGDFVSCLRGALDHLATALTHCKGGTPNHRASFPVIGVNNAEARKAFRNSLKGVPLEATALIESLQPYHQEAAYKHTHLWKLHRLWNIDKHRRIPLSPTSLNMKLTHPEHMPPISNGQDGCGVVTFPLAAKPYVEVNPVLDISIQFGDVHENILVPYAELDTMYGFVRSDLMPRFKKYLQPDDRATGCPIDTRSGCLGYSRRAGTSFGRAGPQPCHQIHPPENRLQPLRNAASTFPEQIANSFRTTCKSHREKST